jgi:hypothetical protein
MVRRRRRQVIEHGETSKVRFANRLIVRRVIAVSFWIVLAAATAVAQHSVGTVTETVTMRRDLNGRDAVSEKVDRTIAKGTEKMFKSYPAQSR